MLISPWVDKEDFKVGSPHLQTYDSPDLKIARAVVSRLKGRNISVINFNWMIAEKNKPVRHIDNDLHELAMYSREEFLTAMQEAGVEGRYLSSGAGARGLYLGTKS